VEGACRVRTLLKKPGLTFAVYTLLLPLLTIFTSFTSPPTALAASDTSETLSWKDTNLSLPTGSPLTCFDGLQPGKLLAASKGSNDLPAGTYSYDWLSGQRTQLNQNPFSLCNESNGRLYANAKGTEGAAQFTSLTPDGQTILYTPDEISNDSSDLVYAIASKKLFASTNGGFDWQERGQALGPGILVVSASQKDARSVYALVKTKFSATEDTYALFFSPNAAQTWEKRYQANYSNTTSLVIQAGLGQAAPVDALLLYVTLKSTGTYQTTTLLSSDGGRNFVQLEQNNLNYQKPSPDNRKFFFTGQSFLRISNRYSRVLAIDRSTDWGKTWQPLPVPSGLVNDPLSLKDEFGRPVTLLQVDWAPANLFMEFTDGTGDIYYSGDGGMTWQTLVKNMPDLKISPYAPLTLIGIKTRKLYSLEIGQTGKALLANVPPDRSDGSLFFPETGHNLGGSFRAYWQAHGGLAQFGFPRTEPFREINAADGKLYTVQYFERNRFEYHPENKGTPYEVQLGLLGNQLTAKQRDAGTPAFVPTENRNYPGGQFFAQTGHNLSAGFKSYWEANGGLAIYGYPISEEFDEVNPEDGKTYTVQYFERNRFEYHPENKGTSYEVLLGLLGNKLLKDKGWLE